MSIVKTATLPNGLKIVHLHIPRTPAAYFGIAVRAGSSDEILPEEAGLAHFVEHTLFKGTAKRTSWHIINRMESVGGELNAFTTKEDTVIYSSFPKGALARAVELITDLILNSRFPKKEIDKEREVVCDEINSYLDSPADAVYDDFEDLLYAGTPLGHNILGTTESVRAIDSAMCHNWLRRNYTASNMVAFYAGSVSWESFLHRVTPQLMAIEPGAKRVGAAIIYRQKSPFTEIKSVDSHQAHTVMGRMLPRLELKDRVTMAFVTNILGGPGMNSVFNIAMRERRGLVYTVESGLSNWNGTSMFTTYFGTDPHDNEKCIDIVNEHIERLASERMSQRRLAAAKKQYEGQLVLSRANIENRIIGMARSLLLYGKLFTEAEMKELIAGISPEDIMCCASSLLPLSSLTLQ